MIRPTGSTERGHARRSLGPPPSLRSCQPVPDNGGVLRLLLLRSPWAKRLSPGVPVAWLLLVAELVILAQHHLSKLDAAQRRRLFSLLIRARGRPRSLTAAERFEFVYLRGDARATPAAWDSAGAEFVRCRCPSDCFTAVGAARASSSVATRLTSPGARDGSRVSLSRLRAVISDHRPKARAPAMAKILVDHDRREAERDGRTRTQS